MNIEELRAQITMRQVVGVPLVLRIEDAAALLARLDAYELLEHAADAVLASHPPQGLYYLEDTLRDLHRVLTALRATAGGDG